MAKWSKNPTEAGCRGTNLILILVQWAKASDVATDVAQVAAVAQSLAWEPPYAMGSAIKKKRKKEKQRYVINIEQV